MAKQKENKVEKVAKEVQEIMEEAYELDVPLKVDIQTGENWGEMEDFSS